MLNVSDHNNQIKGQVNKTQEYHDLTVKYSLSQIKMCNQPNNFINVNLKQTKVWTFHFTFWLGYL